MMCAPTEGIPLDRCQRVFLRRGYPSEGDLNIDTSKSIVRENMEVRICVNTYRLFFQQHTEDLVMKHPKYWAKPPAGATKKRKKIWKEVLGGLGWMKDASEEEKAQKQRDWEQFLKGGLKRRTEEAEGERAEKRRRSAEGDEEMGGM
jgi:paired amphipathic helix protein Sin3a